MALFHSLAMLRRRYAIGRDNAEADPTAVRPGSTWIQSPETGAEKAVLLAEYWDPRSTGRTHRLANPPNLAKQQAALRGVRSAPFSPGGRRKLAGAPWPSFSSPPPSLVQIGTEWEFIGVRKSPFVRQILAFNFGRVC